jgi:DNA-directed RNA polymerase specialized sigma24 family protein
MEAAVMGVPQIETARAFGVTEGYISQQAKKARAKLRALLNRDVTFLHAA